MTTLIITNHISDYRYHQFQALSEKTKLYVYCVQSSQPSYRNWRKHHDLKYTTVSLLKLLILYFHVRQVILLENGKQTIFVSCVCLMLSFVTKKKITLWYGLSSVPRNVLKNLFLKFVYRIYLLRVKNVLFYSQMAKDTFATISGKEITLNHIMSGQQYPFQEEYDRSPAPSLTLPNFEKKKTIKILYIGQDIHRKGVDFLVTELENLRGLVDLELNLVLCGGEFSQYPANEHLNIDRMQYADTQRKAKLFEDADLVVVPSRHDPWPHVAIEAVGFGRLTLISRSCGNFHVVEHLCADMPFDTCFNVDQKFSIVDILSKLTSYDGSCVLPIDTATRHDLFSLEKFCADILSLS